MELSLKPGKDVEKKTSSAADHQAVRRRFVPAVILLITWLASLACGGGFLYPAQLTATAGAPNQLVSAGGADF